MKDIATKIRVFLEGFIIWWGGVASWASLTMLAQGCDALTWIIDEGMIAVILGILVGALVIWVLYAHRKELDEKIPTWLYILLNAVPFALVAQFVWMYLQSFD